jgi:6-phosphogluconolactonase (cycloisomerase 2 family)
MWVATQGDQMVRAYTVNLTSGGLTQVGNPVATGVQPSAMALTPDGKSLFIANSADNSIAAYTVNSDGSLKAQGTTASGGQSPVALAIDPGGSFLFVADQSSGDISVFKISGTTLAAAPGSPFPTQTSSSPVVSGPSAVIASPSGGFLYVANQFTSAVLGFSYDPSSGALTPLPVAGPNPCGLGAPGYCVPVGANPAGLAFSRCAGITKATAPCPTSDGNNLFVANAGTNDINVFSACIQASASCASPDGMLTPVAGGPTVAAGTGPAVFMIHPTANFVYVVDRGSNQVSEYTYSPATGALTSMGATGSTAAQPFSGGITANTSNTNWVYVTNNNASSLSAFSTVGAAGKLVPLASGAIAMAGQPSAILVR